MPLDANIILAGGQQPQQQPDLFARFQQARQARVQMQMQEQALQQGAMQQQAAQMELQQKQQAQQQQDAALQTLQQNQGDVKKTIADLIQSGNPQAFIYQKHQGEIEKQSLALQETANKIAESKQKQQFENLSHIASLTSGIEDAPPELQPTVYAARRALAIQSGFATPDQLPAEWNPQTAQIVRGMQQQAVTVKDQQEAKLNAAKAVEVARHNQTEEGLTQNRDANTVKHENAVLAETQTYHKGELQARGQEIGIQRGRLATEQRRLSEETAGVNLSPQAMENAVDQYAATGALPNVGMGKQSAAVRTAIMNGAAAKYGQMDLATAKTEFANRQQAVKAFSTGTQGQSITSLNTAIGHLDDALEAAKAMNNNNFKAGNKAYNTIRDQFGSDAVTNFDQFKRALSGEVVKTLTGRVTEGELNDFASSISNSASPKQLQTALINNAKIMGSKVNAMKDAADRIGIKGSDQFISPRSKDALQRMGLDPNTMRPVEKNGNAAAGGKRPSLDSIFGGVK